MQKLANMEDCEILRNVENRPGFAVLMDCDGNEVFFVPSDWRDDQIWDTLAIANSACSYGFMAGGLAKQLEIKKALGIEACQWAW